jgi:hypothetical protein
MKALTLWQPWATLVAHGVKPFEFRRWPAPRFVVGQTIAIHAAARPLKLDELGALYSRLKNDAGWGLEMDAAAAMALVEQMHATWDQVPRSAVLCTAKLAACVKVGDLPSIKAAPERAAEIDPNMWAWRLADVQRFEPWIPAKGAQGFWDWLPPQH